MIAAVYEPWRRWGRKTGGLCGWALWVAGRTGLGSLTPANRASSERCLEGLRDVLKRGLPTPVTLTTLGRGG